MEKSLAPPGLAPAAWIDIDTSLPGVVIVKSHSRDPTLGAVPGLGVLPSSAPPVSELKLVIPIEGAVARASIPARKQMQNAINAPALYNRQLRSLLAGVILFVLSQRC